MTSTTAAIALKMLSRSRLVSDDLGERLGICETHYVPRQIGTNDENSDSSAMNFGAMRSRLLTLNVEVGSQMLACDNRKASMLRYRRMAETYRTPATASRGMNARRCRIGMMPSRLQGVIQWSREWVPGPRSDCEWRRKLAASDQTTIAPTRGGMNLLSEIVST